MIERVVMICTELSEQQLKSQLRADKWRLDDKDHPKGWGTNRVSFK